MKRKTFGRLLEYRIGKKGIEIEKLAAGLCSVTSLRRIVKEGAAKDFFLMERVLERLGMSANKVSLMHNEKDDYLLLNL